MIDVASRIATFGAIDHRTVRQAEHESDRTVPVTLGDRRGWVHLACVPANDLFRLECPSGECTAAVNCTGPHLDRDGGWHTFLAAKLGVAFPTAAQEAQEPGEADRLYESATRWLLEQTRDTSKHSLLFTENISYGFRRNMLGMRWIGMTAAVLAAIWLGIDVAVALPATWADFGGLLVTMPTAHRLGATVCIAAAAMWVLGVSRDRVRAAAFAYAERLIAGCDALADRPPAAGASGSEAAKQNLGGSSAG